MIYAKAGRFHSTIRAAVTGIFLIVTLSVIFGRAGWSPTNNVSFVIRTIKIGVGGVAAVSLFFVVSRHLKGRRTLDDYRTLVTYLDETETLGDSESGKQDADVIAHVTAGGDLLFANEAFQRFVDIPCMQIYGQNFFSLLSHCYFCRDSTAFMNSSNLPSVTRIAEGKMESDGASGRMSWIVRRLTDAEHPGEAASFLILGWHTDVEKS